MLRPEVRAALDHPLAPPEIAAEILQVSERTAVRMIDRGLIAGFRLGPLRRAYSNPLRKMAGLPEMEFGTVGPQSVAA